MNPIVKLATVGYKAQGSRCGIAALFASFLIEYKVVVQLPMCAHRFLFDAVLLGRKLGLIWIAKEVKDSFLASVLALSSTVCVWALAITWKPTKRQMQLRSLQMVLLSLHVLMLLQSSGHAQPRTMTVLHALWLALLCVVLCAAIYSAGVRTCPCTHHCAVA
ncbi:MAG: hypothetical protein P4L87_08365 [Formivibrio sp.]|nr:hypothetical protein [Formivibrio sp.]